MTHSQPPIVLQKAVKVCALAIRKGLFVGLILSVVLSAGLFGGRANAQPYDNIVTDYAPPVTDSRIKTYIYNEGDVYDLLAYKGYQSNIEFDMKESIVTISVGDRMGWQVIPSGRRLFIRPLRHGLHTNMTVVTTERAYQFDLRSAPASDVKPSGDLVYVMRFFYPEQAARYVAADVPPVVAPPVMPAPHSGDAGMHNPAPAPAPTPSSSQAVNYHYTYEGSDSLAPVKIYDDGSYTYIRFGQQKPDTITVVLQPGGQPEPVTPEPITSDIYRVSVVATHLIFEAGDNKTTVYNESLQ